MGYTTQFNGTFTLDKPLTEAQRAYLVAFNEVGHYAHDQGVVECIHDPLLAAVGMPLGPQGAYIVSLEGRWNNGLPRGVPNHYCQWRPTEDGTGIEWDQGEKFYDWAEWLTYLVDHFLKPWGYVLNGRVVYQGEDTGDVGHLVCEDNVVTKRPFEDAGGLRSEAKDVVLRCLGNDEGSFDTLTDQLVPPGDSGQVRKEVLGFVRAAANVALIFAVKDAPDPSSRDLNPRAADLMLEILAPLRRFK